MPLEVRMNPDGTFRPNWYGRYEVNGKRYCENLGVKIAGTPPEPFSLKEEGDGAFERSRATALAKLEAIVAEARSKRDSARLVEKLYEIKTGERIQSVRLADLPDEWAKIPRKRTPNERYVAQCRSTLARFVAFVRDQNPQAQELVHVTQQTARAFMEAETTRGVTAKTWNDTLKLLRATCKYLLPAGSINSFAGVPTRQLETVFRKPFTPDELKAILDTAQRDDFIRPIIIAGIWTAMRRGDCCLLKWTDVDMDRKFINVKTAKTGVTVDIPILPMLYQELARRPRGGTEYVFPEQARMYLANPDGITWRVRKILAQAGFKDSDTETTDKDAVVARKGIRGEIHADRQDGLRRASVRDFHSFRVTWITLALTAGVPLEIVRKVTGHRTVDVVLKHYFHPGREEYRQALEKAMPSLLPADATVMTAQAHPLGSKDLLKDALEALDGMEGRNWGKQRRTVQRLVRQAIEAMGSLETAQIAQTREAGDEQP